MAYEIRRACTQPLPPLPAPASPVASEIASQAPVNEEHLVIVRREVVVHEHYARMGDGTLIAILPPGAKPAYTPAQAHQPQQIEVLTRPMLVAPTVEQAAPRTHTLVPSELKRTHTKAASPAFILFTLLFASAAIYTLMMPRKDVPAETAQSSQQSKTLAPQGAAGPLAAVGVLQGSNSLTSDQVEQILVSYNSPAKGQGQVFADLGAKYGIDDIYAVAFFLHESTMGTACPAWAGCKAGTDLSQTTHNIGNIMCTGNTACYGRFRDYPTWEAGIEDWYRLIHDEYLPKGLTTVDLIIPTYAPSFENDVTGYENAVTATVAEWRAKYPAPAGQAAPAPDSFVALTRCEKRADGWHVVGTIQNTGAGSLDLAFKDIQIHDTQTSDSFATAGDGTTRIAPGQRAPVNMTVPLKDGHSYMIVFERPSGSVSFPISDLYYCGIQPTR